MVRSLDKDILDIGSHLRISHNFIALIDNKELDFFELNEFVFGKIVESSRGGDDDMGIFGWIFELILIFFEGYSTKIASKSELWFFEISS